MCDPKAGPPERRTRRTPVLTLTTAAPESSALQSLTMRPPYRRGPTYTRCGLRLRQELLDALRAEGRRRRRWMSDLAEELLQDGLARLRGRPLSREGQEYASQPIPQPSPERHWIRLALDGPFWELLQRKTHGTPYSVPQLIRQMIGDSIRAGIHRSGVECVHTDDGHDSEEYIRGAERELADDSWQTR